MSQMKIFFNATLIQRLLFLICFSGFLFSLWTFYPGWMSPDSFAQYKDALSGQYHDWHPIGMALWWRVLNFFSEGPFLFLFQNLLFYWLGLYLLSRCISKHLGAVALFFPFVGLWPGIFMLTGELWKDIVFSSTMLLALGVIANEITYHSKPRRMIKILIFILFVFGISVKPNGLVAMPFLWMLLDGANAVGFRLLIFGRSIGMTLLATACAVLILKMPESVKMHSFQYQQIHDLLGISARSGQNFL